MKWTGVVPTWWRRVYLSGVVLVFLGTRIDKRQLKDTISLVSVITPPWVVTGCTKFRQRFSIGEQSWWVWVWIFFCALGEKEETTTPMRRTTRRGTSVETTSKPAQNTFNTFMPTSPSPAKAPMLFFTRFTPIVLSPTTIPTTSKSVSPAPRVLPTTTAVLLHHIRRHSYNRYHCYAEKKEYRAEF